MFERDGAKLVVDDISFGFIKGATVDFTEELIRASFAVRHFSFSFALAPNTVVGFLGCYQVTSSGPHVDKYFEL